MDVLVSPDDPALPGFLGLFKDLVSREFEPLRSVRVETLNREPAPRSAYAGVFLSCGFQRDRKTLTLWRPY